MQFVIWRVLKRNNFQQDEYGFMSGVTAAGHDVSISRIKDSSKVRCIRGMNIGSMKTNGLAISGTLMEPYWVSTYIWWGNAEPEEP